MRNEQMSKDLYITDKQYLLLLKRARKRLDKITSPRGEESRIPGNKYVASNVGLCDDKLTTKETAMWPKQFPKRRDMKYLKSQHKCPLDTRPRSRKNVVGCFYTCRFFQNNLRDIKKIKALYDKLIQEMEEAGDEK